MQTPQKKEMQLQKLLLISSITLISSCATHSPRMPPVTVCVIDYPRAEAICKTPGQEMKRIPLKNVDRNVCFSPDDWELVQGAIDELSGSCQ